MGPWKITMAAQLHTATLRFRLFCAMHHHQCSHPDFSVLQLSLSRTADAACLKSKAHNCFIVSLFLQDMSKHHTADGLEQQIGLCLWGLAEVWLTICEAQPRVKLNDDEIYRLTAARDAIFHGYHAMSSLACSANMWAFEMRPKFHRSRHCLDRCIRTRLSLAALWSFGGEDTIGAWARMCRNVHGSAVGVRAVERWLLSYFS